MTKHLAPDSRPRLPLLAVLLAAGLFTATGAAPAGKTASTTRTDPVLAMSRKYENFERKLESFRVLPDNETAANQACRTLALMGKSAPPALGGLVIEAACAGFIACGADASYTDARKALGNPRKFEERVLVACPSCGGARRSEQECRECHGSGRCPIPNCNNGRRFLPMVGMVACPTCKGTARCQDCKGTGRQSFPCSACGGSGKKINRDEAQTVYRERIEAAVEECRRNEVVVERAVSGSGTTLAKATADALVNAVRKIHGPEGADTQKLLGPGDKTIVKGYTVVSKREDESGLFQVKVDILVAKTLQGAARPRNRDPQENTSNGKLPGHSTSGNGTTRASTEKQPVPQTVYGLGNETARTISVSSRNMSGTTIGSLNQGDEITFQYLDGEWTNWTSVSPRVSPDDPGEDTYRLAVIDQSDPKKVLAIVPTSTARDAFRFRVFRRGTYAVRMNENLYEYGMEAGNDNDGSVRYAIQVIRASDGPSSVRSPVDAPFDSGNPFGNDPWN